MHYFHDTIKLKIFFFLIFLLDENTDGNILIYEILYKNEIVTKQSCIRFNKVDGFVRVYERTR